MQRCADCGHAHCKWLQGTSASRCLQDVLPGAGGQQATVCSGRCWWPHLAWASEGHTIAGTRVRRSRFWHVAVLFQASMVLRPSPVPGSPSDAPFSINKSSWPGVLPLRPRACCELRWKAQLYWWSKAFIGCLVPEVGVQGPPAARSRGGAPIGAGFGPEAGPVCSPHA